MSKKGQNVFNRIADDWHCLKCGEMLCVGCGYCALCQGCKCRKGAAR